MNPARQLMAREKERKNMGRNNRWLVSTVLSLLAVVGLTWLATTGSRQRTVTVETPPAVTDIASDGVTHEVLRTFRCVTPAGETVRDWQFANRWTKGQLTHDSVVVDGRRFDLLRFVDNDPNLPLRHMRLRRERMSLSGPGPLEGHTPHQLRLNGQPASLERDVLIVEHNIRLEPQRRPLPPCGTPRS